MNIRNSINYILFGIIISIAPFLINRVLLSTDNQIIFLNIGQGDASLICSSHSNCGLIDTGKSGKIIEEIRKYTYKPLSFILITHPDKDHNGELYNIVKNIGTEKIFLAQTEKARELLNTLKSTQVEIFELRENNDFLFGDFLFDILWPSLEIDLNTIASNDTSTAVLVKNKNTTLFLAGDLGSKYEDLLQSKHNISNIDILKISHHGSKNSSSLDFLTQVNPTVAIISVGKNSYGHPSSQVLEYLKLLDIDFLQTSLDGDIRIKLKRENLEIDTENSKNSYIILNKSG